MVEHPFEEARAGNPPANYERYFVPAIGAPLAEDLVRTAALRPGEQVLDVACGTGVVARLAAEQVGAGGEVAGLDVEAGMLAVARGAAPSGSSIAWHEASAEAMPFGDASFDAVLCQMGLQFMPHRTAALREMKRVLAPGGRLVLNLPGPTPPPLAALAKALARNVGAEAAGFVERVFSLHDTAEIEDLVAGAGYRDVSVRADDRTLRLPPPAAFLWQYVLSTPLAGVVASLDGAGRAALERDMVAGSRELVEDDALVLRLRVVTAVARA